MVSNVDSSGPRLFKKALRFRPKKSRTYILPTKFGMAFGATVLVLFFFAVGYANNLIYLFVFFLIAVALVGTWATNKNIEGVNVLQGLEPTIYAGEESFLEMTVTTKNPKGSYQLEALAKNLGSIEEPVDVFYDKVQRIKITATFPERGLQKIPRITLQSEFPFGLLRSWKAVNPWMEILVYPRLEGVLDLPAEASGADQLGDLGVFREHRSYGSSDPLNRIDWKASARRTEVLVKHYEDQAQKSLSFRWEQTANLQSKEKRISQLALWIDQAHRNNYAFSLELPFAKFTLPDMNENWRQSMKALALLKDKDLRS